MTTILGFESRTLSVTDAAAKGLPGLVRDVEHGEDVVISRHGKPVAAVISIRRVHALRALESDLRDLALVLSRAATDSGRRTSLDDAIAMFGYAREELEAENAAEAAADA